MMTFQNMFFFAPKIKNLSFCESASSTRPNSILRESLNRTFSVRPLLFFSRATCDAWFETFQNVFHVWEKKTPPDFERHLHHN